MNYDVLVIAGTTESREVIESILSNKESILASVATELGKEMLEEYPVDIHVGRLDREGFVKLLKDYSFKRIVDASHPFAKEVTRTVKEAASLAGVPYERYERQKVSYDYEGIVEVRDVEEAIDLLNQKEGNVLLTTGVNTAAAYMNGVRGGTERLYIRVLDNVSSYEGCRKAGYEDSHVFGEMPPFSVEDNLRLIRETGASVMVSKDSGKSGGVDIKVQACKEAGIPMILIRRPSEDTKKMPRILLAGANSGCGKTSITCGILKALHDRGLKVQAYKCGPDYIDPMLHSYITKRACRNLDPFFSTKEDLRYLMAKNSEDADITVTEGVMGYYDGVGVTCEKSTHTVSVATESPTVLILNVKGMSHTMLALIKGLLEYRKNPVKAVILNRCSKGMYEMMKPEIEKTLHIRVAGYFPVQTGIEIPSRHLGLMTAEEIGNLDEIVNRLGKMAEESIDLNYLLELGQSAPALEKAAVSKPVEVKARIAVARDKAFCFYYQENLDVLRQMGAELVFFSPVEDSHLPESIGGIYLGGGYPEAYAKKLSANESMLSDIRDAVAQGKPLIAECGGFMYTADHIVDTAGNKEPMLGLVDTDVIMTKRLSMQFGYVTLTAKEKNAFMDQGESIRAHEFHYSKAEDGGNACRIEKYSGKQWEGVHSKGRLLAGYPHLYFHNCKDVAKRFVDMAAEYTE